MKKAVALFLFGIFLFNTAGYFIAFKSVQYQIKNEIKAEIKEKISSCELTTIVINLKQLNKIEWLEKGKELKYNGELYDVVRHTENDTSITYYCINDKQEELLFANLEEHINTHISADKPLKNNSAKKIVDHVIKLYFSNESPLVFNSISSDISFFQIPLIYTSAFIKINSPPPEFV